MKFLRLSALVFITGFGPLSVQGQNHNFVRTGFIIENDRGADGILDSRFVSTNRFDARGRLLQTVLTADFTFGVNDYKAITTYTWDNANRLQGQVTEYDFGVDGSIDYRVTTTAEYDNRFNFQYEALIDLNLDGSPDASETTVYSYDHPSATQRIVDEFDNNLDGIVDSRLTTLIVTGHSSQTVTAQFDADEDGVIDQSWKEISILNVHGEFLSTFHQESNGDGSVLFTATTSYTYDAEGNLLQTRKDTVSPGPTGPTHDLSTTTFFYAPKKEASDTLRSFVAPEGASLGPLSLRGRLSSQGLGAGARLSL